MCAIEIEEVDADLTDTHEVYVYPKGKYDRKVIRDDSLTACFQSVINEIKNGRETTLPIGAFSVWQQNQTRRVTAVDLIFAE